MKYMQNQESFSFSTYSKTGLFSDDEDGDADTDGHNHTGGRVSGHHQNDYFEISLPPPPPSPSTTKTNHSDSKEEEFEFCFSFNSSSTLIDFPTTPISASSNYPFHHHDPPMTTTTFATSQLANVVDKKHNHHNENKSMNYKRIFQSASSPRYHQGLISPYVFPPSRLRTFDDTQLGLIKNRNLTRLGGIGKFLVKLRSIKSMLRSSLNASRRLHHAKVKVNKKNKKTSIDHKQSEFNHTTNQSNDNNDIVANAHSQKGNQEEEKSSRRMNFYGFSKMFDVIMRNLRAARTSKQTDSKSCPVSIKSCPLHDPEVGKGRDERRNSFYSRDHSIQAAIAHCKKSIGK
ncbi:hypothetical protein L1987_50359 [Smallanthus sonchifolius]|uniref:Uncharacterized protein n=1 Tax=Smallanthus sonchifolius TaxID=185202 RepID=A0ACB9ENE2_9ASTR|nr:hypothetical protein L1987_50359 [Smallanthus sonchifolius]